MYTQQTYRHTGIHCRQTDKRAYTEDKQTHRHTQHTCRHTVMHCRHTDTYAYTEDIETTRSTQLIYRHTDTAHAGTLTGQSVMGAGAFFTLGQSHSVLSSAELSAKQVNIHYPIPTTTQSPDTSQVDQACQSGSFQMIGRAMRLQMGN